MVTIFAAKCCNHFVKSSSFIYPDIEHSTSAPGGPPILKEALTLCWEKINIRDTYIPVTLWPCFSLVAFLTCFIHVGASWWTTYPERSCNSLLGKHKHQGHIYPCYVVAVFFISSLSDLFYNCWSIHLNRLLNISNTYFFHNKN